MKYEVPSPSPSIAALLILPVIFLGSNYVAMQPYALIFSFFVILFFFFSPFYFLLILLFLSLLILLVGAILRLLILPFFDPFLRPYLLHIFVFFLFFNILSPAPPIAASLIHMALVMIYM
jgi:hypothetical protein